jgi:hypothetical protein
MNVTPTLASTKTAIERLQGGAVELNLRLLNDCRTDLRRYNAPTVDEVGTLMVGGDMDGANARNIVIHSTNGYFQHVSPLHSAYAPLHYVLLFPDGRNRWHDNIPLNGFQWDGSGFIQDDENGIGGKRGSAASPCINFTHTYHNITSTRNGFYEPEGFYSNSLLTHMHVLNKTA